MTLNAKAGGDSSARGMVVAMILGMNSDVDLPTEWINGMKNRKYIDNIFKEI